MRFQPLLSACAPLSASAPAMQARAPAAGSECTARQHLRPRVAVAARSSDIEDFLNSDDDDNSRLLITFEGKDVKCTKTPPTIMKKKGKTMFFLKVTPRQAIEKATIKEQVRRLHVFTRDMSSLCPTWMVR